MEPEVDPVSAIDPEPVSVGPEVEVGFVAESLVPDVLPLEVRAGVLDPVRSAEVESAVVSEAD